jgi:hypothetical protein
MNIPSPMILREDDSSRERMPKRRYHQPGAAVTSRLRFSAGNICKSGSGLGRVAKSVREHLGRTRRHRVSMIDCWLRSDEQRVVKEDGGRMRRVEKSESLVEDDALDVILVRSKYLQIHTVLISLT